MRLVTQVAIGVTLLMHASATGSVAAPDDPATTSVAEDRPSTADRPELNPYGPDDYLRHIQPPRFFYANGFAELYERFGASVMGEPLELEHPADDADAVQLTTKGLAVWHAGEAVEFTDGWRTYTLAPDSVLRAAAVPAPASAGAGPPIGVWDRLAACEASGDWGNVRNPKYKGGLQMDATFWANYGGLKYAAAPQYATRAQQIEVAIRGQAVQGWGAWPVCSRILGLR